MYVKTNILRLQTEGNCYSYQLAFNIQLTEQDILEIESYIESLDNNIVYAHPHLYANNQLNVSQLDVLLSRGETVRVRMELSKMIGKLEILPEICHKLLRSLNFMAYRKIKTYFNPFQEANNTIPGLYLEAVYEQTYTGIAFLPVTLVLEPPVEISSAKILLNYSTGTFYEVSEIVRVDKLKNLIHFRKGGSASISSLKKCNVKEVSGLLLAERLRNNYARIKESCKEFLVNWGINFQANFFANSGSLISAGNLVFRENKQKVLSQIIHPMARNSYNNNFRQFFKGCAFQSLLQSQLIFITPNAFYKQTKQIIHEFEKLSQKMSMKLKVSHTTISTLQSRDDLYKTIQTFCTSNSPIYILVAPKQTNTLEEENITYFKEDMIGKQFYFHILRYDQKEQSEELDIVALRNLGVLLCKMRLVPWKIKSIPFGEKPTVVFNIDVTDAGDGKFSISVIASMNAFLSKFCCLHSICPSVDRIQLTIFTLIQKCLNKFCSIHKLYPLRVFVYRTGILFSLTEQQNFVRNKLTSYYQSINYKNSSIITYIQIKKSHPFRTFLQSDQNYISKQTVKKTQLLFCNVISGRYYIQLQFDEAPVQLQIYEQENDPTFVQKVLELTAKLCYGSVGNQYGKGMGFLGYAAKLNTYKQFKLQKWEKYLYEGVMLFL